MACQLIQEAQEWNARTTTFIPPIAILNAPDAIYVSALQDGQIVGVVGYQGISWPDGTAEMFTGVVPEQRKGFTFPALVKEQLSYGFNTVGLRRITMTTLVGSPSARMAELLAPNGVRKEGTFPNARLKRGTYHDVVAFGVERSAYV